MTIPLASATIDGIWRINLTMKDDNKLLIVVGDKNVSMMLNREEHRIKIMETIAGRIGKQVDIEIRGLETNQSFEQSYADLSKVINMDIEIED